MPFLPPDGLQLFYAQFIAYAALRLLGGTLFASSLRVSPLHMLSVVASLFAMTILLI
jgi:hypothetical protein